MNINIKENGEVKIISIEGKIDSNTSYELAEVIDKVVEDGVDIIVDFTDVLYISSSGLRVLLEGRKDLDKQKTFKIINASDEIMEIFDITGFLKIFEVERKADIKGDDIKALFFDVDGTLVDHKTGQVPESATEAILKAKEKGLKIVMCTGRPIQELHLLPVLHIPFDAYLILNGNICLDSDMNIFAGTAIIEEEVEILRSIFEAKKVPLIFIGDRGRYINFVNDLVIQTQDKVLAVVPEIGEYKGEKIYQCLCFVDNGMRQKLEKLLDHCSITSWHENGIDIISKAGGKETGIQAYLNRVGLKRSQSMAFGDGENDIPMIRYAGIGVSMGNGIDTLKQEADYITSDVGNDGIKNALEHFGIIWL